MIQHILIVEDEPILLISFEDVVASIGARVSVAENVDRALAVVRTQRINLVLLDIYLRSGTSFPLATELTTLDVPFIFLTGSIGDEMPLEFATAPRLEKPFTDEVLRTAVIDALAQASVVA